MSGSVNKVIIVGNLGREPEIRHSSDGSKICTLSVATSESWKDRVTGERKEKTEWHRTVIFNDRLSELAEKYLRKGSKVFIEGQVQTRKWTNQEGKEQFSTEIVISQFKGELTLLDNKSDQNTVTSSTFSLSSIKTSLSGPSSGGNDCFNQPSLSDAATRLTGSSPRSGATLLDDDVPF